MLGLLKIVLSANFWIGAVVATLAVVGYLYANGNKLRVEVGEIMADQEKFDIKKFLQGFISPVTNAKNVQFVVWLALIVLIGFTIGAPSLCRIKANRRGS